MMVTSSYPPFVTEDEFLTLPESHEHVELIDGEVILAPSPSAVHQKILRELTFRLESWCRQNKPAELGLSPLDLRIGPSRIVQPDLFIVSGGFPSDVTPVNVQPALVIEVLSFNRAYDRITKRHLYAEAGIAEYWIVDPIGRNIERVRGVATIERVADGALATAELPGLEIDVVSLFAGLDPID